MQSIFITSVFRLLEIDLLNAVMKKMTTPALNSKGCTPETMKQVLSIFLSVPESEVELESFASYQSYYNRTWFALGEAEPPELDAMKPVSDEHVQKIVKEISRMLLSDSSCLRPTLRDKLLQDAEFQRSTGKVEDNLNRKIDLALRLWLVLYIRKGFAHATKSITWDDNNSLQDFISSQFRKPKLISALAEKMFDVVMPDNFIALNLRRYSGIEIEWTSSLNEHLNLNRENRKLKVFRLKYYLWMLRKRCVKMIKRCRLN